MVADATRRSTTSVGEDLVTAAAGVWLTAGLFIDGYAHENLLDTANEDFFTPYHALFYAGFAALVGWVAILSLRNRPAPTLRELVPRSYAIAVAGLAVFGVGGIADAIWHQALGVESGLDALISPSHLFLMMGLLLLFGAPVHAAHRRWREGGSGWSQLGPGVVAGSLATAILAFFNLHSWGLVKEWATREAYVPSTDAGERAVALFASGSLFSTTVLFACAALLRGWMRVPPGGFVALFAVPNLMLVLAFDRSAVGVVASVAGAIVLELAGFRSPWLPRAVGAAALSGLAMWAAFFATAWATGPIRWPASIWSGMIVLGGITAGVVTLVVARPGAPGPVEGGDEATDAGAAVGAEPRPAAVGA